MLCAVSRAMLMLVFTPFRLKLTNKYILTKITARPADGRLLRFGHGCGWLWLWGRVALSIGVKFKLSNFELLICLVVCMGEETLNIKFQPDRIIFRPRAMTLKLYTTPGPEQWRSIWTVIAHGKLRRRVRPHLSSTRRILSRLATLVSRTQWRAHKFWFLLVWVCGLPMKSKTSTPGFSSSGLLLRCGVALFDPWRGENKPNKPTPIKKSFYVLIRIFWHDFDKKMT